MNRLYSTFLLLCLLSISFLPLDVIADAGNEQLLLKRAKELLENYKDTEALQVYEEVLATSPQNYEALCKASFLHCRIGERYDDETRKTEHFEKAKSYAILAYGLKPEDAESNYVMALSIGSMAMVSGASKRLEGIHYAKAFVDKALEKDNEHAGAWYLLGKWHFKMANLNMAEAAAAKILFGGASPEASNLKAIEAIQQAIRYNPKNIRYYFDLATIYKELDEKEACVNTLEKALVLDLTTSEDLEMARRCKIMLQDEVK